MKSPAFATGFVGQRKRSISANDLGLQKFSANDLGLQKYLSIPTLRSTSLRVTAPSQVDGVLSTEDIGVGILLAVSLAFLASYLQGRRNQTDIVLWNQQDKVPEDDEDEGVVFGADEWKDMSRPENYVLYSTKVRKQLEKRDSPLPSGEVVRTEKSTVVIALLVLFVPIFSFEFFLGLSRQIVCGGDPLTQTSWALELCSPHYQP